MNYITLMIVLGIAVLATASKHIFNYFISRSFFNKLDSFISKDLKEDDVKYIVNSISNKKLYNDGYNWEVLVNTIVKINGLDIDQEVIDTFNSMCEEKGVDVEKVLNEHYGE